MSKLSLQLLSTRHSLRYLRNHQPLRPESLALSCIKLQWRSYKFRAIKSMEYFTIWKWKLSWSKIWGLCQRTYPARWLHCCSSRDFRKQSQFDKETGKPWSQCPNQSKAQSELSSSCCHSQTAHCSRDYLFSWIKIPLPFNGKRPARLSSSSLLSHQQQCYFCSLSLCVYASLLPLLSLK